MKIISGGQTGIDQLALTLAQVEGHETGGFVPKGWLTENGPDPTLARFGCVEHKSSNYPPRTFANVRYSDATIWIGNKDGRGYGCTMRAIEQYNKPFQVNPLPSILISWVKVLNIKTLNVAGPRGSHLSSSERDVATNLLTTLLKAV